MIFFELSRFRIEFGRHPGEHGRAMISICGDSLPHDGLTYLAFRLAFQDTLERIVLSQQIEDTSDGFGYLTEVPFLRSVPPHVQIDLLADTWARHTSRHTYEASLVDESVIYAVCETAARIAEEDPTIVTHAVLTGPLSVTVPVDQFLAGEFRNLHLKLANEGDFLLLSQFEDIPPDEAAEYKQQYRLDDERAEAMFEVLGQWGIAPMFGDRIEGLITERELVRASYVLGCALRSRIRPKGE